MPPFPADPVPGEPPPDDGRWLDVLADASRRAFTGDDAPAPMPGGAPVDGYCVCDDGPPALDCGIRAHRDAAADARRAARDLAPLTTPDDLALPPLDLDAARAHAAGQASALAMTAPALEALNAEVARLRAENARLTAALPALSDDAETSTYWLGIGHPGWPDPLRLETAHRAASWLSLYGDRPGVHVDRVTETREPWTPPTERTPGA